MLRQHASRFLRTGRRAERAAARYLRRDGYRILTRNARVGSDELDLIARRLDQLVFVEVKYRSQGLGSAADALDSRKLQRFRRAARRWMNRQGLTGVAWRLDFIGVTRGDEGWQFEHRQGVGRRYE